MAYSDAVCSDMQCVDPNDIRMCISKRADDGTPCGNKKVILVNITVTLESSINS